MYPKNVAETSQLGPSEAPRAIYGRSKLLAKKQNVFGHICNDEYWSKVGNLVHDRLLFKPSVLKCFGVVTTILNAF